ncbi:MAG: hypothetical protein JST85_16810 [Acidobacteria bacterium]|nr:hypothetical protein [Acidobacteriota bacterium]
MKSKFLSIFSDSTESDSVSQAAAESQPIITNHLARYQEFLSHQYAPTIQTMPYRATSAFRLLQGLFSLAVFVILFLTILTLFGFGLSTLGVIAQVSPAEAAAASKQNSQSQESLPTQVTPKKKAKRH